VSAAENTWTLEFPYRRSLGPVVGAFFTGLRERKVLGSKTRDGRVLCPPLEYDPETGEAVLGDLVDVSPTGTVEHAVWVDEPMRKHPLDKPFAWALVKLDGADTTFFHALDAPREAAVRGARVQIRWRDERQGHILDIECFEPSEDR
jgi:uncharacterized OB-fold protein